jgi:molybdenum cofactor biosynthesis protein B
LSYQEHKKQAPLSVSCVVLTISDSRTEQDDASGQLIKDKLSQHGHRIVAYAILKNQAEFVSKKLLDLLAQDEPKVIITTGGTGASHLDITVDTVMPLLDKKLDGFGELFRFLTYQQLGTASILSRAMAGVAKGKVIICLPGSRDAVDLALEKIILPEIGHVVREATR